MVYLKALLFVIFVPGTFLVAIPYFLLASGRGLFEIGIWKWFGLVPLVLGGMTLLGCVWDFARIGRGTPVPIDPPKVLVKRGMYRFTRNPMYVGVLATLGGEALLFQSLALLGLAIFMGLIFHLFVVFYEEPVLRRKFGNAYEEYLKSVPRWIPRL
jgi:protein-S-isoprenylcysteine O-methyltransferase Ste14